MKTWDGKTTYKYLHLKRDGICIEVLGETAITRGGHIIDLSFIPFVEMIPGKAELWYPGKPASHVKTALLDLDQSLILEYFCSSELHWSAPLSEVKKHFERLNQLFIDFIPYYEGFEKDKLDRDQEGWILKNVNRGSEAKWKPHFDKDMRIKGYVRGKGKYSHTLGAVILGSPNSTTKVSGMSDKMRDYIWNNRGKLFGKLVEIRHNGVLSRGGLRHPRFIRFREDLE